MRISGMVVTALLAGTLIVCNRTPGEEPQSQAPSPAAEHATQVAPAIRSEPGVLPAGAILPDDFTYLGAFRLPDDGDRPRTFEYGGSAMTFRPDGDPGGEAMVSLDRCSSPATIGCPTVSFPTATRWQRSPSPPR